MKLEYKLNEDDIRSAINLWISIGSQARMDIPPHKYEVTLYAEESGERGISCKVFTATATEK